jgi:hypothetical protein
MSEEITPINPDQTKVTPQLPLPDPLDQKHPEIEVYDTPSSAAEPEPVSDSPQWGSDYRPGV